MPERVGALCDNQLIPPQCIQFRFMGDCVVSSRNLEKESPMKRLLIATTALTLLAAPLGGAFAPRPG